MNNTESAKDAAEINRLRPIINRLQNEIMEYRRSHGIKPGEPLLGFPEATFDE